jgi:hypothetical protein
MRSIAQVADLHEHQGQVFSAHFRSGKFVRADESHGWRRAPVAAGACGAAA